MLEYYVMFIFSENKKYEYLWQVENSTFVSTFVPITFAATWNNLV